MKLSILTCLFVIVLVSSSESKRSEILDNDFESGTLGEWTIDMSLPGINDIQWKIEQASDNTVPIVPPVSGSFKYLRASRLSPGACGLTAIKSPEVTVSVGDKFTFSYWMQSRYHGFNNILVSLAVEEDNEFVSYTII